MASAAGCMSAQWNGALTFSIMARLAPYFLAASPARSTAALRAADDHLARIVVVGDLADLALGGLGNGLGRALGAGRRRPGR